MSEEHNQKYLKRKFDFVYLKGLVSKSKQHYVIYKDDSDFPSPKSNGGFARVYTFSARKWGRI